MSATEVLLRLVRECASLRGRIAAAALSLVALSAAQLHLTWLAKVWADALVPQVDQRTVRETLVTAALVTAGMALAMLASRALLASINQGLLGRLREALQERLLRSEVAAVRGFAAGDLTSRAFFDVGTLSGFAGMVLKRIVGEGFLLVGAIAMMLHLEWRLALAGFLVAPPLVLLVATLGRSVRRRSAIAHAEIGAASAMLGEQIAGLTTIKGFETEAFERERFARQSRTYAARALHAEGWSAVLTAGVWLVTGLGLLAIAGYGTHLVAAGHITSGGLLSFCLYAIQVVEPSRRMSEVLGLMQKMVAAADRVFAVIDLPWVERGGSRSLTPPVRGEIVLDGVVFSYRPERRVLDRIDLEIRPNEALAVVAASGGGKSTMAALLQRFYDPAAGAIRLDGIDLRELRLDELRRAVCVVEQDAFLFAGTLAENVRYGSWTAAREAVEAAIEQVGLEPLVRSLPGGLDARLQEGGRDLSGGQRQRIALARAIVREPRVLVLDEATSAIDGDAEGQIFARLSTWLARRVVIVMAHRLSTVSRFPRIVVLGDGRVLGDGGAAELERTCPPFRRLFAEQLALLPARAS